MNTPSAPAAAPAVRPGSSTEPACRRTLAQVAAHWRSGHAPALPAPLVDWLFTTLDQAVVRPPDEDRAAAEAAAAAWPSGAAQFGRAMAGLAALDELEGDCLRAMLSDGSLDAGVLGAVHAVFGHARLALVGQAAAPAHSLQQALLARDRQLSVATHELRTPISSILLNLQMLERAARTQGTLDGTTVTRLLAVPSRQLRRLTRMVDLLLDAAQVENERLVLHPQSLDLCQLVHETAARLHDLAQAAGCVVDLHECQPVQGRWDRLRLEQVVTNLLTNAIKYGGGRVTVRTQGGAQALLQVQDDGAGIALEDQERIFEPYERVTSTSGEDGAGLGLYIVREIVRAHGGRISVDSSAGQGARFTVTLPMDTPTKENEHRGEPRPDEQPRPL